MNFPFSTRPPGPISTIIRFQFSETYKNYQDPTSPSGKLWAACIADVAQYPAWHFTLRGRSEIENRGKCVLIVSWKGDRESVVPSWTTMSDDGSTPSAFAPLLPLLECPPEFQNLVFRPLLSAIGHPHALPTDFITLFIPAQVSDDAKLALFGRQIHRFNNTFAHVSHEAAGEMIFASRGWSLGESEDGETKEVVHVLVHVWKNADDERRYKHGEDKKYERFLLEPLREAESLGVEWSEIRMLMTRV